MRVEWSAAAVRDRDDIFDYFEEDNPDAAARTDLRIATESQNLAHFPAIGRPGRVRGTRELAIQHTPFLLVDAVTGDCVRVLRVLHGARRWPDRV